MPIFTVEVNGDKMTDVTLHSTDRVPFPIPGAKNAGGKQLDRSAGDYVVLCTTQYGTPGMTITCTVWGANGTQRQTSDVVDANGKLTLPRDFRLLQNGEVA